MIPHLTRLGLDSGRLDSSGKHNLNLPEESTPALARLAAERLRGKDCVNTAAR